MIYGETVITYGFYPLFGACIFVTAMIPILAICGKKLLLHSGVIYMVLTSLLLCIIRLLVPIEMPSAKLITSRHFLPHIQRLVRTVLFSVEKGLFSIRLIDIFMLIWLCGTIFLAFYKLNRTIQFHKYILQNGSHKNDLAESIFAEIASGNPAAKKVSICQTPAIDIPLVIGLRKIIIFLPETEFDRTELFYILSHEWNHFRKKDLFYNFLLQIILCIYWWFLPIYFLKKYLCNILELRNDYTICKELSESEQLDYLQTMLKIMHEYKRKRDPNAIAPVLSEPFLECNSRQNPSIVKRFAFILDYKKTENHSKKIYSLLLTLLISIFFIFSYSFIIQPCTETVPPEMTDNSYIYSGSPDDAYILHRKDGTYALYSDNEYIGDIPADKLSQECFEILDIKEEN